MLPADTPADANPGQLWNIYVKAVQDFEQTTMETFGTMESFCTAWVNPGDATWKYSVFLKLHVEHVA